MMMYDDDDDDDEIGVAYWRTEVVEALKADLEGARHG